MIDFKIFWGPLIHAIGANAQVTQIPEFKICLQGQEIHFQCKSTPLHMKIIMCIYEKV